MSLPRRNLLVVLATILLSVAAVAPRARAAGPELEKVSPSVLARQLQARTLRLEPTEGGSWGVTDGDGYRYDPTQFARAVGDHKVLQRLVEDRRSATLRRDGMRSLGGGLLGGAGAALVVGFVHFAEVRGTVPLEPDSLDYAFPDGSVRWSSFHLAQNAWWEEHNVITAEATAGLAVGAAVAAALGTLGVVIEVAEEQRWRATLSIQSDPSGFWTVEEARGLVESHNAGLRDELDPPAEGAELRRTRPPSHPKPGLRFVLGPAQLGLSGWF